MVYNILLHILNNICKDAVAEIVDPIKFYVYLIIICYDRKKKRLTAYL